ncbi:MAG: hypothetical protein R3E93_01825 [Thiothrix sp.]
MALEVGGKSIPLDEEGYLENRNWTPEVAAALATAEGRRYYLTNTGKS